MGGPSAVEHHLTRVVRYEYDLFDRRVLRIDDPTPVPDDPNALLDAAFERFVYDVPRGDGLEPVLLDFTSTGGSAWSLARRYLTGPLVDQVLAQENLTRAWDDPDRVQWLLADQQGTVRDVLDRTGQHRLHVAFDAFGGASELRWTVTGTAHENVVTASQGNLGEALAAVGRYWFQGRELDAWTNFYYVRARWLDPLTGTWLSEDPIRHLDDWNLSRFVKNDPVNATDPTGLAALPARLQGYVDGIHGLIRDFPAQLQKLKHLDPKVVAELQSLALDLGQFSLDVGGIFDPTPACDGVNGAISLWRGDGWGAGLSACGMVPYLGDLAKAGKLGKYAKSVARLAELAAELPEVAQALRPLLSKVNDLASILDDVPRSRLPGAALPVFDELARIRRQIGEFVAPRGTLQTSELWGNSKTLADHFRRHGADFGAKTADDYVQQASRFFQRSQLDNLPTKVDSAGVIRVYDPKTNTFGSFNPDGTIKTFYKPDPALHKYPTNLDYWNAQPGTAPWTP